MLDELEYSDPAANPDASPAQNDPVRTAGEGGGGSSVTIQSSDIDAGTPCVPQSRLPGMPDGFFLRDGKIMKSHMRKGSDTIEELTVCSPLYIIALARYTDGTGWARIVSGLDQDGNKRIWHLSEADLGGAPSKIIAALRHKGFWIARDRDATAAVVELISDWSCERRVEFARTPGWHGATPAFVMPSKKVIGSVTVTPVDTMTPLVSPAQAQKGSLKSWRDQVGAFCTGNSLLMFAVSAAFAAPLLHLVNAESGGAHFRGLSGSGKTSLLRAAVSVWGPWEMHRSWRTTANALEHTAAMHNDMLLPLDELGEISGAQLGEAIYLLGNGQGKKRLNNSANPENSLNWRVMVLSTGEKSAQQHMAAAGHRYFAGQEARLLDIAADERCYRAFDQLHGFGDGAAFSDALKERTLGSYGTPGLKMIEYLTQCYAELRSRLPGMVNSRVERLCAMQGVSVDPLARRAAHRFALIQMAGELATGLRITGWDEAEPARAIGSVWLAWNEARDIPHSREVDAAKLRILDFVAANRECFHREDAGRVIAATGTLAGWIRDGQIYILPEVWRALHDPEDSLEAARLLRHAGILVPGEGDNLARKLPSALGRGRAYTLNLEVPLQSQEAAAA